MSKPRKIQHVCDLGHTWETTSHRNLDDCPYCAGRRAWPGFNDLATMRPDIASWWDVKRNDRSCDSVLPGSTFKAWWICREGHYFQDPVHRFAERGYCLYCANRKVWTGFNDIATLSAEIAQEFDRDASGKTPDQVCAHSTNTYPWKCQHGHAWSASPKRRVIDGNGCPYCSGNKVWAGFNDMATTHPELADQMDSELTGFGPEFITAGSNKKIHWKCEHGHSWKTSPSERTRTRSTGCPYCSGRRSSPGVNDLLTLHPQQALWWDSEKNGSSPEGVSPKSNRKAWWVCDKGHSFEDHISHMTASGLCPYCIGRRVLVGFNDLPTTHPELVEQWDVEANLPLTPEQLSRGSKKKVWWVCPDEDGHRWQATPNSRTRGRGCPDCWRTGLSRAEEELALYVSSLLPEDAIMNRGDRRLIAPYEVDIHLPSYGVAIEFNGVWWHSEAMGKGRSYHYDKWRRCRDAGVQLITVWEDDWRDRPDIVKRMIAHKLRLNTEGKVGARTCTVVDVSTSDAKTFLEDNHIQGWTAGAVYLGLTHPQHGLVALSVWSQQKDTLYLDRYATSQTVPGGMGKLLSVGKRYGIENSCTEIITFADHGVSDGGLYEKLGFSIDKELKPDYSYLVEETRKHKFGYRLSRFRSDPELGYVNGYTERQLADLNGLPRVWDAGKTRYRLDINDRRSSLGDQ